MTDRSQQMGLHQSQQLIMTPELRQSIELLQLSALELSTFLYDQLEQNPLLKLAEGEAGEGDGEGERERDQEAEISAASTALTNESDDLRKSRSDVSDMIASPSMHGDDMEHMLADDTRQEWGNERDSKEEQLFHHAVEMPSGSDHQQADIHQWLSSQFAAEKPHLREYLHEQIDMLFSDAVERLIAYHLLDSLDDRGYIDCDLEEIATALQVTLSEIEAVLDKLQHHCDPAGVFARNLAECLAIQLCDKGHYDPAIATLLKHLPLFEQGKRKELQQICEVNEEDLEHMIAELRSCDPFPAKHFDHSKVEVMQAEVLLTKQSKGGFRIELNNEVLPKLLVDQDYYEFVGEAIRKKEEKAYLDERMRHASWLLKALDQRARTILAVAKAIVAHQEAFFQHGVSHLKPLTLEDVAKSIDIHKSTVSRVIHRKAMVTPMGTISMKYFFSSGLSQKNSQEGVASTSVKHLIKGMIEQEQSGQELSDDTIAMKLQEQGINVARRTVAKYRESLGFASSAARRKQNKRYSAC